MTTRTCNKCRVSISEDDYLLSTLQRGDSYCGTCLDSLRVGLVETRVAKPKRVKARHEVPMHPEVRAGYIARLTPLHLGLWLPVALVCMALANSSFHDPFVTVSAGFGVLASRAIFVWTWRLRLDQYDQKELLNLFQLSRERRRQNRILRPKHLGVLGGLLATFCLLNPSRGDFDAFQPNRRGNVERQDFMLASMYAIVDPRPGATGRRRFLGVLGRFWELPA